MLEIRMLIRTVDARVLTGAVPLSCSDCGRQDVVIDDGAFLSTLGLEIDAGGDCRH